MAPGPEQPTALRWAYRAVDLYRAGSAVGAVVALLVANAIPIVGVALFGWSLMTILVLYWLENGIVGLWNLPRIAFAEGQPTGIGRMATLNGRVVTSMSIAAQRAFTIPFFLVHYGIFWVVHGIFVFALPLFLGFADAVPRGIVFEPGAVSVEGPLFGDPGSGRGFGPVEMGPLVVGAIALFISHGVSFALELHRPRRIPSHVPGGPDVRALRATGRAPPHDRARRLAGRAAGEPDRAVARARRGQDGPRSCLPPPRAHESCGATNRLNAQRRPRRRTIRPTAATTTTAARSTTPSGTIAKTNPDVAPSMAPTSPGIVGCGSGTGISE